MKYLLKTFSCRVYLAIVSEVAEDVLMYTGAYPTATTGHAFLVIADDITGKVNVVDLHPSNGGHVRFMKYKLNTAWDIKSNFAYIKCITEKQKKKFYKKIQGKRYFFPTYVCSSFASDIFYDVTGVYVDADEVMGAETPRELGEHIIELNGGLHRPVTIPNVFLNPK